MVTKSLLETTYNTRDLGGHKTSDGKVTLCDRIYRSDRQENPSPRDIELLLTKGITTVIDLRTDWEIKDKPSGFATLEGFNYHSYSVLEGSGIPDTVEAVPGSYIDIACEKNMRFVFETIANAGSGVMYNCAAGKDRTGVVTAVLLMRCGVPDGEIIADYMVTKECNKERFELIHQRWPELNMDIVIPRESFMGDFLKLFKAKFGSAEGYFESIGVSKENVERIKDKLLNE